MLRTLLLFWDSGNAVCGCARKFRWATVTHSIFQALVDCNVCQSGNADIRHSWRTLADEVAFIDWDKWYQTVFFFHKLMLKKSQWDLIRYENFSHHLTRMNHRQIQQHRARCSFLLAFLPTTLTSLRAQVNNNFSHLRAANSTTIRIARGPAGE